MPGPIALAQHGDDWQAECRLCDFLSAELPTFDAAAEAAYDHVVAEHPEVEEP